MVGGGPAGLEAARVAALRGHRVTLFERELRLGGQLGIASEPPRKHEVMRAGDFLMQEAQRLGVEFFLGRVPTQEELIELEMCIRDRYGTIRCLRTRNTRKLWKS